MSKMSKTAHQGKSYASQSLSKYVSPTAAEAIREEIARAKFNEVFFRGIMDEHKQVVGVEVCARGDQSEVPAFSKKLQAGDVIIHNHPHGPLVPSKADLNLSARFAQMSVGSYIVDNNVKRIYVVVEPFDLQKTQPLSHAELAREMEEGSAIARNLSEFEVREAQLQMLKAVADAFNNDLFLLVEAGTGTGKTMAYLLPAIHWALNNKERVVISTNTINLQEQLIHKDIPLLQNSLDREFKAALMKGRSNYVCPRKLDALKADPEWLMDDEDREALSAILAWARTTKDGSLSDLSFQPKPDVWERVCSESDYCASAQCPHQRDCFVNAARREAASANILVANHHLLFADLALRRDTGEYDELAVLPPYNRLILDEAHNLEDVATSYMGKQATRLGFLRLLGRLFRKKDPLSAKTAGLLAYCSAKATKYAQNLDPKEREAITACVDRTLIPLVDTLAEMGRSFFDDIFELVGSHAEKTQPGTSERKLRITEELRAAPQWQELAENRLQPISVALEDLSLQLGKLKKILSKIKWDREGPDPQGFDHQIIELRIMAERVTALAAFFSEFFRQPAEGHVYWMETRASSRGNLVSLHEAPLLVADEMKANVYPHFPTIVFTSATLTSGRSFDFLKRRIGLNGFTSNKLHELALLSPFDFERQVVIALPTDLPLPSEKQYVQAGDEFLLQVLKITRGRAFILFTSFGHLSKSHANLEIPLKDLGIMPLKQGTESRLRLLEKFKRQVGSVLFATSSFWEGVDVEGEALECVVLARLPFRVPTEPIHEARWEAVERQGGNPFLDYAVPQAVIKFRQGIGRLIRRKTDRGVILVLDKRILTKNYGKVFLQSLPPGRIVKGERQRIFEEIGAFFGTDG